MIFFLYLHNEHNKLLINNIVFMVYQTSCYIRQHSSEYIHTYMNKIRKLYTEYIPSFHFPILPLKRVVTKKIYTQILSWFFRGLEIHLASFVEAFRLLKLFNSPESNSGTSLCLPPTSTFEHLASESMYVHNISKI